LVIPSNKLPFLESRPRDWARSRSTGNSVEMSIFLPIYPLFRLYRNDTGDKLENTVIQAILAVTREARA
jgi:hypothetical protein